MKTFESSDEYIQNVSRLLQANRGPLDIIREIETFDLPENPSACVELLYTAIKGTLQEETEETQWELDVSRENEEEAQDPEYREAIIDSRLVSKSKELIGELETIIRNQHKISVGPYEIKAFYTGRAVVTKFTAAATLDEAKKELAAWSPFYLRQNMNGLTHLLGDHTLLRASVTRQAPSSEYEIFSLARDEISELYQKGESQWFGMLNPHETKVIKIFFVPFIFRQVEDRLERIEFTKDGKTSNWIVSGSVNVDQKIRTQVNELLIEEFSYHGTSAIFQIVPRDFEKDEQGNAVKRYSINVILQEPIKLSNNVRGWRPEWKQQSVADLYSVF